MRTRLLARAYLGRTITHMDAHELFQDTLVRWFCPEPPLPQSDLYPRGKGCHAKGFNQERKEQPAQHCAWFDMDVAVATPDSVKHMPAHSTLYTP